MAVTRSRKEWRHPSCRAETIFPRRLNLKREASIDLSTVSAQTDVEAASMFELVTAFIALFSASIFLAHGIEAYQARRRTVAEAPATSR